MVCMKWHSSIFSERQTDLLSMWLSYCTWGVYWGVGEGRTCVKTLIKDTESNRIIILKSWRIVHKAHCYPYYSSPSHPICKFTLIIKKLGYGTWRQRENTCKVNIFFKNPTYFIWPFHHMRKPPACLELEMIKGEDWDEKAKWEHWFFF